MDRPEYRAPGMTLPANRGLARYLGSFAVRSG